MSDVWYFKRPETKMESFRKILKVLMNQKGCFLWLLHIVLYLLTAVIHILIAVKIGVGERFERKS